MGQGDFRGYGNLTLKSGVAKPDRTIKIPCSAPSVAPLVRLSCSCSSGLPVPFRCYGRVCLIPRLTLELRVVSPLLSWTVMHEPPVQSDYHAFKATVPLDLQSLKTQRIATWWYSLVTGLRSEGVLTQSSWSESPNTATLEGQIWLLRSVKASYHESARAPTLGEPSKKPPAKAVFFVWPLRYDR